jgi:hypothetical protein
MKFSLADDHGEVIHTIVSIPQVHVMPRAWHSMLRGLQIPMAAFAHPKIMDITETIFRGYILNGRTFCDPGRRTCL